jgi:hypothetical protein
VSIVAHPANLSYTGDRDQKDHSSKQVWAKSYGDLIAITECGDTTLSSQESLNSSPGRHRQKHGTLFKK